MLQMLEKEANKTLTENGAVTLSSTGSDCLDLFATIGAIRFQPDEDIASRFLRAYMEDPNTAMKIAFYGRDVRGGLGERHVFRVILRWLAANKPESVRKNIDKIAEYGRYDDLLCLLGTSCEKEALSVIANQFHTDMKALEHGKELSLLGKWLPSVNASCNETVKRAKKIARALGLSDKAYRKSCTALRKRIRIIENNLREKDYTFDYSKQPSKAMLKYRKAFVRNDQERYEKFLDDVDHGKAKLHVDTLMPYEIAAPFLNHYSFFSGAFEGLDENEVRSLNTTWNALPDFCDGRNALAVVDTSGSMFEMGNPLPASVAYSLGLYFAERNKGEFHNHFIMFSERPRLIELKGETFADRLRYLCSFNEIGNTDIEAVFDLVLNTAVKNHVPQKEMPDQLVIISDMEFDRCTENAGSTNFDNAKRKFREAGYHLPQLVFWNAQSRGLRQPVSKNEQGVVLVSGCTPRLFSMVAAGDIDPYRFMMETVTSDRYAAIVA